MKIPSVGALDPLGTSFRDSVRSVTLNPTAARAQGSLNLEHHEEREAIARRRLERCVASGYWGNALMARDWPKVKQIYAERRPS